MKKMAMIALTVFSWALCSTAVLAAPNISGGMTQGTAQASGYEVASVNDTSLAVMIGKIISYILAFVGTIFFALTIYAGILWMTASGNEEQVTKAIGIIKMATIGLVITMAAYTITFYVKEAAGGATGFGQ